MSRCFACPCSKLKEKKTTLSLIDIFVFVTKTTVVNCFLLSKLNTEIKVIIIEIFFLREIFITRKIMRASSLPNLYLRNIDFSLNLNVTNIPSQMLVLTLIKFFNYKIVSFN